jgi:hypothetical protein
MIYRTLTQLGCKPSLKGFDYLKHCIKYVQNKKNAWIGEVYNDCAGNFGTTYSRVERAIRHCIQVAVLRGDVDLWHRIFSYSINSDTGTVTNGEFIYSIAKYLANSHKEAEGENFTWVVTITSDYGLTTRDIEVQADTFSNAYLAALNELGNDYLPSKAGKGILNMKPLKN